MKRIFSITIGVAVLASALAAPVASAQATPFKKAELSDFLSGDAKAAHAVSIDSRGNLKAAPALSRASEYGEPIFDLPEGGEYRLYSRSCEMIYYTYNGLVMATDDYFAGEVVLYDNGDVYMRNMIPSMVSGSYLKGRRVDNKIILDFPQALCYDEPFYDDYGNLISNSLWPVYRGTYEMSQVWDEEYEDYVGTIDVWVDEECQTITFTINDDGSITQDEGGVIGVFTQGEIWYGEAAWDYKYTPFEEKVQTMPEGVTVEDWAFYDLYDGFMTKVAIDGDYIYWQGMYKLLPESVVKGRIDGDRIYFESPAFIGVDPATAHLAYFAGTETINNWITIDKKPRFNYDAGKKEITYPRKHVIINAGPKKVNLIADFNSPTIHYQGPETRFNKPIEPVIKWVSEFEYEPVAQMNCWFTVVDLPNIDVDGNMLDRDRMWYNFYFDNELFWFDTYDYGLVQDSPDVPYTYDDGFNIFYQGNFQHYVYFYWTGYYKMGVQSVFEDLDGNVHKSDIAVYINPQSKVETVETEADVVDVVYYDLMGRKVDNPNGLCIKQTTYADGSVVNEKCLMYK